MTDSRKSRVRRAGGGVMVTIYRGTYLVGMPTTDRDTIARLVHGAMIAGVVAVTGALVLLRPSGFIDPATARLVLYVAFGFAAVACTVALLISARLAAAPAGDPEFWWATHLPRALVAWALLDAAALFAAVAHFLTSSAFPFVITGVALVLFLLASPGRLRAG